MEIRTIRNGWMVRCDGGSLAYAHEEIYCATKDEVAKAVIDNLLTYDERVAKDTLEKERCMAQVNAYSARDMLGAAMKG